MSEEVLENAENEAEAAAAEELETQQTEEVGDGQPNQDDEDHADDNAAKQSKKTPAGKRIRQLTRKWRDAERQNEQLVQRLESLEKRLGPPPEPERPNRDDFDSVEEYEDALFEWRDNKGTVSQSQSKDEPAELPEDIKQFQEQLEDFGDEVGEDVYWEVMHGDWKCNKEMTDYIMTSDRPAQLAWHLAKHPEVSEKIYKMPTIRAVRELEKVEEQVSSNTKPSDDSASTPPPPLDVSKPNSAPITDQDKMSTKQWLEMRRKQLEAKYS